MKTKSLLNRLFLLLFAGTLLASCTRDMDIQEPALVDESQGEVVFTFSSESSLLKSGACDMADVVVALITVQTASGEATDYTLTPITVYKLSGRVFTQKIALTPGEYKLVDFLLADDKGNMQFAVPLVGSPLESQVAQSLPMSFTVSKDLSRDYPLEVICVDGYEPEDFGLTWFGIAEVDVCRFLISVSELGSNTLLDAEVTIHAQDYNFIQSVSGTIVPNLVYYKCGLPEYTLSVSVPGYENWSASYSAAELKAYEDVPIVVELLPQACGEIYITDLIAAQNVKVGVVKVIPQGATIDVVYQITEPGWYLEETHLSVVPTANDLPMNSGGNPILGQFEYQQVHNPIVKQYTYTDIAVGDLSSVTLSAHAYVSNYLQDMSVIEAMLPKQDVKVTVRFTGHPSYFETTITGSDVIDGTYPGNCIDLDNGIMPGRVYDMKLVSSYTDDKALLALLVDKPDNLELVNYAINQDYSHLGATGREMQAVVWTLADDIKPTSGTGGIQWNQNIVDAIVADAFEHGVGFVPHCGEKALVIVDPGVKQDPTLRYQVTLVQITTIAIDNVCEPVVEYQTAWGKGPSYPGPSWGMYFDYCVR